MFEGGDPIARMRAYACLQTIPLVSTFSDSYKFILITSRRTSCPQINKRSDYRYCIFITASLRRLSHILAAPTTMRKQQHCTATGLYDIYTGVVARNFSSRMFKRQKEQYLFTTHLGSAKTFNLHIAVMLLLVGCLSSKRHASVYKERVCSDNCTTVALRQKLAIKPVSHQATVY